MELRIVWVERDMRRALVYTPPQSRASSGVRPGPSGLYPVGS